MSSHKSLLKRVSIRESGRMHDCQRNNSHKLPKGVKMLVVKEGRDESHYCIECGAKFIEIARSALKKLEADVSV